MSAVRSPRSLQLLAPLCLWTACAQGSLDNGGFGFSASGPGPVSTTATATAGDSDGGSSSSGAAEASGDEASTAAATTTGDATASSSGGAADTSTGGAASSSDASASMTDASMTGASMTGGDPPPEVGEYEDCAAATCVDGSDCIELTDLPANDAFCSPQCTVDADCPAGPGGDALPVCALSDAMAVDPTNCVLLCEYDGLDYGTCPGGMSCTSIPGQTTSISVCMW
ncbi:MAG: hypothetical protein IPK74_13390 [Deltaproteobacteria bacterium]|nr:hypothetical protein [Deltaproteobacteria bacterium]